MQYLRKQTHGSLLGRTGLQNTQSRLETQAVRETSALRCNGDTMYPQWWAITALWYQGVKGRPNCAPIFQDTPVSRTVDVRYFQSGTNRNGFMLHKKDGNNGYCLGSESLPCLGIRQILFGSETNDKYEHKHIRHHIQWETDIYFYACTTKNIQIVSENIDSWIEDCWIKTIKY